MLRAFNCKKCGRCCSGKGGIIISDRDMRRICAYLGLSPDEFVGLYTQTRKHKLEIRQGDNGACIFFIPGKGCRIHRDKPDVCRAWPFFRGNLVDPISLEMAREYCPGINPKVSFADFCSQGLQYIAENNLLRENDPDAPNALKMVTPK